VEVTGVVDIHQNAATMQDVISQIRSLNNQLTLKDKEIAILQSDLSSSKKQLDNVLLLQDNILQQIRNQSDEISDLGSDLTSLTSALHNESGEVQCGDLGGLSTEYPSEKSVHVKFTTPYDRKPNVMIAVKQAGVNPGMMGFFFNFITDVLLVDTHGFTLMCKVASGAHVEGLVVSWVSM